MQHQRSDSDEKLLRIGCVIDDVTKERARALLLPPNVAASCLSARVCEIFGVPAPPPLCKGKKRRNLFCTPCKGKGLINYLLPLDLKGPRCHYLRENHVYDGEKWQPVCAVPPKRCLHLPKAQGELFCEHHFCLKCSMTREQTQKREGFYTALLCLLRCGLSRDVVRYCIAPLIRPWIFCNSAGAHLLYVGVDVTKSGELLGDCFYCACPAMRPFCNNCHKPHISFPREHNGSYWCQTCHEGDERRKK